jgi:hypothetical protein
LKRGVLSELRKDPPFNMTLTDVPMPSAVYVQGIASFDPGKLARGMGMLTPEQTELVRKPCETSWGSEVP